LEWKGETTKQTENVETEGEEERRDPAKFSKNSNFSTGRETILKNFVALLYNLLQILYMCKFVSSVKTDVHI